MVSFLEYASEFEIKKNEAVESFLSAMKSQRTAFNEGTENNRSWVKKVGPGYVVKLGKVDKSYSLASKDAVNTFFDKALAGTREDQEFIGLIEAAYGKGTEAASDAPKKTRGSKRAVRLD